MKHMKMTNAIISMLLSVTLVTSFCPIPAFADDGSVLGASADDAILVDRVDGSDADEVPDAADERAEFGGQAAISAEQIVSAPDAEATGSETAEASAGSAESAGLTAADSDVPSAEDEVPMALAAADTLKFIYIDADVIEVGETQYIAVALSDDFTGLKSAELFVKRASNGEELRLEATNIVGASALFELTFDSDVAIGAYALHGLRFSVSGSDYAIDFARDSFETVPAALLEGDDEQTLPAEDGISESHEVSPVGMPIYAFEVRAASAVNALPSASAADGQTTVLALDGEDQLTQVSDIDEGLSIANGSPDSDDASDTVVTEQAAYDRSSTKLDLQALAEGFLGVETAYAAPVKRFVIALDPGHGGYDGGAMYNGLREKDLNLSIAQYCRDALQSIPGVSVYMTRDDDTYVTLQDRVNDSVAQGADVIVSIHCNAASSSTASGSEVWVPNDSSWKYEEAHVTGYELGSAILDELVALGLDRRGVYTRDCTTGDTYADGSLMDYYTVVSKSREYGIPGIIVEHAFVSSTRDSALLADDSFLKKLGEADARGIISYYGLDGTKPFVEDVSMENGSITLRWTPVDGASSYAIARYENGSYYTYTYDCADCTYTIDDLVNGESYEFLVQANVDGAWNEYAKRDHVRCKLVPPPHPLVASVGNGTAELSWEPIDGAESYAVAEYVDGDYVTYTLECTDTAYTVRNISNGTAHAFLVQACVNGSWSLYSSADHVSATPDGPTRPAPSAEAADGAIRLSWEPISAATRYAVATYENDGSYTTYTIDCTETDYVITGLVNGRTYECLVQAYVDGKWSAFDESDHVSARPMSSLAPDARVVSVGDRTVTLGWEPVAGAERYAIAEVIGNSFVTFTLDCTDTSYVIDDLSNGVEHAFLVQANVNGAWSSYTKDLYVYATPNGMSRPAPVAEAADGAIRLSWEPITGASRYAIATYDGAGSYTTYTLDCTAASYTITGLTNGRLYECLVQAYVDGKWSEFSDADHVSARPLPMNAPAVAATAGDGTVTLSWEPIANAERYAIYQCVNGAYRPYTEDFTGTSYTVGGLANEVEYAFLVQARVGGAWSPYWSDYFVYATPNGLSRPVPEALASDASIVLSWEPIANAERYAIATYDGGDSYTTYALDCADTSFTIPKLENGRIYECLVQAYVDGRWSAFDSSNHVLARPMSPYSPDVQVDSVGNGTVTLSWDLIDGAERYAIAEYANGSYKTFTYDCTDTSYIIDDCSNQVEHAFLVQALVNGSWSPCTHYLHVFATPNGPTRPAPLAEIESDTVLLMWDPIPAATRYAIARYDGNGAYHTYTLDCVDTSFRLDGLSTAGVYYFLVQAYVDGKWSTFDSSNHVAVAVSGTPIMGASQTTIDQMVRRYSNVGVTYPASTYAPYGAATIRDFCSILLQEANDEGVRAEVLFAQIMHETGWLQFGGDVQADQCNFGGIGATGNGEPGCSFNDWGADSVRKGIRAQVQHLKAYASTDDCVHEIVDPRFSCVASRGCAPTVQALGGKWATGSEYGDALNKQVTALLAS